MSLPAINEGQRHYMGQIVMGMKTGNLFQVAQNLEAAVNSQVPIPQEFLATVHLWMKSRAQTESGLSQMQLAQFIGASSFNSQVQANVQMLAQTPPAPASPPPPPPASPPPASPPLAGSALPASPPLPNSPMFIPSPPLPSSPMYVESPLMTGARDLRRPAEPSQGPKDPKGPGDRRPAEPAKPPSTEARDSRRPAEPDLPPRRRHPLPPPPSTTFGSACSSSYLGSAHIAAPPSSANWSSTQASPLPSPPPPPPPPMSGSAGDSSSYLQSPGFGAGRSAWTATEATPRQPGDGTPTVDGGWTPQLYGASTPTVMPTDSVPTATQTATHTATQTSAATATLQSTEATTATLPGTNSVPTERNLPVEAEDAEVLKEQSALTSDAKKGRRGPVWRRGWITTQERTFEEIANYLLSGENDYASFQEICKNFDPPADPQQIRAVIERYPDRFTVSRDTVTVVDAHRKEAITCMIKKLVVRDMAHVEIDPNKACEHIWQAAHYALKATPCRVAQILGSVAKATLTYPDEVGKGVYPANMPLALACLIDRMVYLARQRGSQLLEKALSPKLYDILLRRWVVGRIKGSQFLANMILLWERLGYFEAKDLDKCKESLYILIAYARHDGVPDPPDKDSGDGWYKIAARDAGEQKNTEPICSQDQLQALERERQEEEDRERQTMEEEFQKRRQRTMHAMAQMGLGEEEKPDVPTAVPESPKEARDVPVEAVSAMFDALDEEELFGSALPYNSAVYSDEEEAIFGSPVGEDTPSEMPPSPLKASGTETEAGKEAAQSDTVEPQPLPEREVAGPAGPSPSPEQSATEEQRSKEAMDLGATQPYSSQGGDSLPATQAYQDEPSPKRRRTDSPRTPD